MAAKSKKVETEAPARKTVDLDAELAKQRGTFAVGIQATIRDLMRTRK